MARRIVPNSVSNAAVVNLRCPHCRRNGAFSGYPNINDALFHVVTTEPEGKQHSAPYSYGLRICPNLECAEPLFVITSQGKVINSFPSELLDFEPASIPPKILASFEEAVKDHANSCFRSAAIMVRRTLEEICADKNATGNDLKARISALRANVVIPVALLEAADELRILGNDAAHLDARVYDDVGKVEVEVAIDLCKEILKSVYQLDSLVKRLRNLKSKA